MQALEPIRNSLDARDRGSVVHWALEAFYSAPTTRDALLELLTENPAEFEQRLDSAIESATQKLQQQHPEIMGAIFTNLERARLKSLLQRFLLRDSERASFITGVPEKAYTLQIGALSLNLKIDRVDTLADKSVALIDYKTGKSITALSGLDTERPEDMQLPVYYRTVSQEPATQVSALAIAQVHNEAVDYHALSAQPNFDPQLDPHTGKKLSAKKKKEHKSIDEAKTQWNIKTQHWTDLVEGLADEFIRGDCSVSPIASKTVCERCGLQSLCRIKELEGNVDRDDEDDSELGISSDE